MNDETEEKLFLEKTRAVFRESVAALDGETLARLRAARSRAVEAATGRRIGLPRPHPWGLPAGALALLVAVVVGAFVWWNGSSQPAVPFAVNSGDDLAIVLSNDNLEMYQDMDFYRWLEAQQDALSSPANARSESNG